MDSSNAASPSPEMQQPALPELPQVWIGYLLGLVTIIGELIAADKQPEVPKFEFVIPPLYVFLPSFVGLVYWLVCVYRIHALLARVPNWKHPISPARAVGFHLIPLFNLYWVFKWPVEIARFVNQRVQMVLLKPGTVGITLFLALVFRVLDPGPGLVMMFLPLSYVVRCMRSALAAMRSNVER